ncbi:MAG: DUF1684 domain-containing protein [Actinomycetaceae bacterium]|nr:DUF1684 domain-containing protein [Actinomycetaceae bacterium]
MTPEESWRSWREERNETLASEHGWLTLIALTWLGQQPAKIEGFPGVWSVVDDAAHARFQVEDDVRQTGDPVEGEVVIKLESGSDFSLACGTRVAEVARRAGGYIVRVRDSQAPTRQSFTGVPVFDYDPAAVVAGTFDPYESPRDVPIRTANPDVPGSATLIGEVSFVYDGKPQRIAVQDDGDTFKAVFHDETNGTESAGWRYVNFPKPEAGGAGVTIDFNRALNFPAAFTPFGTCPQPPEGNDIAAPVRAGERKP